MPPGPIWPILESHQLERSMAPAPSPDDRLPEEPHRFVRLVLGASRMVMLLGILSLIIAAATLLIFGAMETIRYVSMVTFPTDDGVANRKMFLASIKLVDLVLLATVLLVVAFGLYALFIDDRIPVPLWLRTGDVDKLKQKLAGIVIVMLGVLFLELVITAVPAEQLLYSGGAIAAVIVALSFFINVSSPKK